MKKIIFLFILILNVSCTSKNVHKVTFHFEIEGLDAKDSAFRFDCYKVKDIEDFNAKMPTEASAKKMVKTPDGQTVEMPVVTNMKMPAMPKAVATFTPEGSGKDFTVTFDLPQVELTCLVAPMSYLSLSKDGQSGEIFKPTHPINIYVAYNVKTKTLSTAEMKDAVEVKKLFPGSKP